MGTGEQPTGGPATRLWGGRFEGGPADALARLSLSVHFDWRLARYDLRASRAHARMLHRAGLLTDDEAESMLAALDDLDEAVEDGSFRPTVADEDVHTALERGLLERLGSLGGKLRAGRSRNDQVATDLRLYLRDHARLIVVAAGRAADGADRPGRGEPATPGARHDAPAARAAGAVRPPAARPRAGVRPGRGPAAGLGQPGGDQPARRRARWPGPRCRSTRGSSPPSSASRAAAPNSMDAVADRDFAAEFCFAAALTGVHLSRLGEEIVLWSSQEFGWVEIDDAYATGSSIMPQKKNPDVAELARGKAGRLIGDLTGLLTTLKGLPLTYNRDLQEDKEPVFDAVDTLLLVLPGDGRPDRDPADQRRSGCASSRRRASPSPPTWPSTWCSGACRSARRTRSSATSSSGARSTTSTLDEVSDEDLAKVSPAPDPGRPRGADRRGRARRPQGLRRHRPGPGRRAAHRAARTVDATRPWAAAGERPSATGRSPAGVLRPARRRGRARTCSAACSSTRPPTASSRCELTEVEAYAGEADPASHAYRGRPPATR